VSLHKLVVEEERSINNWFRLKFTCSKFKPTYVVNVITCLLSYSEVRIAAIKKAKHHVQYNTISAAHPHRDADIGYSVVTITSASITLKQNKSESVDYFCCIHIATMRS